MDNSLQLFNFKGQEVRVVTIEGEPRWIAADACKALDLKNVSQAVEGLDEDEKGICIVYTLGGPQKMLCVNEPGLYGLIFVSRKEEAKVFKRWLKHVVLPSIRKTGSYSLDGGVNFEGYDEIKHLELQDDPELLRQAIQFYEDLMLASSDKRKLLKEIEKENYPENSFTRGRRKPMNIKFFKKQVGDKVQFGIAILGKERVIQRAMWSTDRAM
jgi:prophage antirepressor-like protein